MKSAFQEKGSRFYYDRQVQICLHKDLNLADITSSSCQATEDQGHQES